RRLHRPDDGAEALTDPHAPRGRDGTLRQTRQRVVVVHEKREVMADVSRPVGGREPHPLDVDRPVVVELDRLAHLALGSSRNLERRDANLDAVPGSPEASALGGGGGGERQEHHHRERPDSGSASGAPGHRVVSTAAPACLSTNTRRRAGGVHAEQAHRAVYDGRRWSSTFPFTRCRGIWPPIHATSAPSPATPPPSP